MDRLEDAIAVELQNLRDVDNAKELAEKKRIQDRDKHIDFLVESLVEAGVSPLAIETNKNDKTYLYPEIHFMVAGVSMNLHQVNGATVQLSVSRNSEASWVFVQKFGILTTAKELHSPIASLAAGVLREKEIASDTKLADAEALSC